MTDARRVADAVGADFYAVDARARAGPVAGSAQFQDAEVFLDDQRARIGRRVPLHGTCSTAPGRPAAP